MITICTKHHCHCLLQRDTAQHSLEIHGRASSAQQVVQMCGVLRLVQLLFSNTAAMCQVPRPTWPPPAGPLADRAL